MPPAPYMGEPLPGCVSIDAIKPDAYLANARAGNPTAGAHANVQTAVANLLACAKEKPSPTTAALIGHGAPGVINTGSGGAMGASAQHIGLDNQAIWVPLFQSLSGRIETLVLYGVSIGVGAVGANLLFTLAKAVNAPVYGPTGLIYCRPDGTFYLQEGAMWQVATPTMPPTPIPYPLPPPVRKLGISGLGPRVTACAAFGLGGSPLPIRSAMALAGQVHWDQPFEAPGEPAALVTGRLRASFGGTAFRSFTILGDALVRDDAQPTRLYPVGPGFRAIILGR